MPQESAMSNPLDQHRSQLADLCRAANVTRLDLFGSAARGEFDATRSDLDFLVEFEDLPPVALARSYLALKEQLEGLFGCPVDLLTTTGLENPYLRRRIQEERLAVYAR
jgi:predicted nucleotidyltransferase